MALRCNNCGWDNTDTAQLCIKCNTKLSINNLVSSPPVFNKPEVPKIGTFEGTIKGKQSKVENILPQIVSEIDNSDIENPNEQIVLTETLKCPDIDCGFINIANRDTCVKCKKPLFKQETTPPPFIKSLSDELADKETVPVSNFSGTIDPYRVKKVEVNKCYLGIIPKENEKDFWVRKTGLLANREFEGKEGEIIYLNRDNIDPTNNTITSKTQAEISFEGGKWFLVDRSLQKTTFILVTEKMELKDGDILLMGDRRILFKEDNNEYLRRIQST